MNGHIFIKMNKELCRQLTHLRQTKFFIAPKQTRRDFTLLNDTLGTNENIKKTITNKQTTSHQAVKRRVDLPQQISVKLVTELLFRLDGLVSLLLLGFFIANLLANLGQLVLSSRLDVCHLDLVSDLEDRFVSCNGLDVLSNLFCDVLLMKTNRNCNLIMLTSFVKSTLHIIEKECSQKASMSVECVKYLLCLHFFQCLGILRSNVLLYSLKIEGTEINQIRFLLTTFLTFFFITSFSLLPVSLFPYSERDRGMGR